MIESYINKLNNISEIFKDHLYSVNFCRKANTITWSSYEPGFFKRKLYAKEYELLLNKQQYTFLFRNGSLVQFYYEFKDDYLVQAKAALYPQPITIPENSEDIREYRDESGVEIIDLYYLGVEEILDLGIEVSSNSHIRLDYDSETDAHCKMHLQFGAINDFRLASKTFPDPLLFMDLIGDILIGNDDITNIRSSDHYKAQIKHSKTILTEDHPNEYLAISLNEKRPAP